MGVCASADMQEDEGKWTMEDIRATLLPTLSALPLAEMQPGTVVKLEGSGGLFNPAPLLNPGWFEGRMTGDEWLALITQINDCTMRGKWKASGRPHQRAEDDAYVSAYRQLRALMPAVSAWWLQHRGINIVCTIGTVRLQEVRRYHTEVVAPCALMFAILPAPAESQLPRASDGTYALRPPPNFSAASDEGQPQQSYA